MKKILIFISILFFLYIAFEVKNNYYVIPDESIRFRVIANSNSNKRNYTILKEKLDKYKINYIDANEFFIKKIEELLEQNAFSFSFISLLCFSINIITYFYNFVNTQFHN